MASLDFYSNYMLLAATKEIVPKKSFFRDRYFPTGAEDIFSADKVLVEYQKGDRKIAAFVADRVGDIPVERIGYSISEYEPPKIAPSRILSLDDLKKRGFGEAIYPGDDAATRAARLQVRDLTDLDGRIARREEWMAVQTMINNGVTVQEYVDGSTQGGSRSILFYNGASDHTYTVADEWDDTNGNFFGDVEAMCHLLNERGLAAADLILGSKATTAVMNLSKVVERLERNSGIITGTIDATLTQYAGVAYLGVLNFNGFRLNLFCADETYVADNGVTAKYFPEKSAMVTAPACGRMMYAAVTQINYGESEYSTIAAARVPKLVVDQDNDIRKLRLTARPLAAPNDYCPFIYAANVVQ